MSWTRPIIVESYTPKILFEVGNYMQWVKWALEPLSYAVIPSAAFSRMTFAPGESEAAGLVTRYLHRAPQAVQYQRSTCWWGLLFLFKARIYMRSSRSQAEPAMTSTELYRWIVICHLSTRLHLIRSMFCSLGRIRIWTTQHMCSVWSHQRYVWPGQ